MKSGNLNFLEPSGPLQAFNGTALPLYYYWYHFCYYTPHALYFSCISVFSNLFAIFLDCVCLLTLHCLLTNKFPFHYLGLWCPICWYRRYCQFALFVKILPQDRPFVSCLALSKYFPSNPGSSDFSCRHSKNYNIKRQMNAVSRKLFLNSVIKT